LLFPVAAYAEKDLQSIKAVRAAKAPAAWPLGTLLVPHQLVGDRHITGG
jgi:hypothetical protein